MDHLVAALLDPAHGIALNSLPFEVARSVEMLRDELDEAGYLAPYRTDAGGFVVL